MDNVVEKFKNKKIPGYNDSPGIRKMQTASGGPITYEEDWSDRWEPYAAKIGLAGDVIGLGTAATGVGIPVGTAIAGFANIPNLIIDGYQAARDTWRSFNDNGNSLGSAAWNGGELILDAAGLKALQYINKAAKAGVASEKYLTSTEKALDSKPWKRVGTGHGRVRARQSADHKRKYNIRRNKALEESNIELAKRGVRPTQGLYYQQKLTDEMAKRGYGVAVNDAIKSANRTLRQNLATISTVSGGTNVYHILPRHKNGGFIRKMLTAAGGPINYKRWDNAKITSYTIPFIKEKAIKLTNAGRATGAVLSTNLLDSIANNAIQAGVPVRTAIGLATKESTLGNPTDDKSAWNLSSKIRKLFNGVYPGTAQHINNGTNLVDGIKLINYHKGDINHEMFNGAQGKSIIQEGLEFYKVHPDKYNPGLKGYQKAVDSRGEEVINSPEVLKWYREWERSKAQIFKPEPYKINTNIQNTAQEFVSRNKQGGKMNTLEFLKNGSGIHIKKKNRGKFTSYCGGKVTDECIRKAKASGNPTLVKRATFAANARKWKHRSGGLINKFQQGGAGWGLLASSVVNAGMLLYATNKLANAEKESAYANNKLNYLNLQEQIVKDAIEKMNQEKKKWLEQYLSGQSLDNSWRSDAFTNYILQLIINQKLVGAKNKLKQLNALAEAEAESEKADAINSAFSSVIQNGLGTLISNLGNKKTINNSVNSTNNLNINSNNFWDNPTIKNSLVTGDFWNNPTIANSLA